MPNYYQILDVEYDAPHEKIHARYRLLALESHPDRSGSNRQQDFLAYTQAYRTLGHAVRRQRYNEQLGVFVKPRPIQPGDNLYQRIYVSAETINTDGIVPCTFIRYEPCSLCWLKGCYRCSDQGMIPQKICVEVPVPLGVRNGATILVEGQGGCSEPNGSRGDLFVYVTVLE